MKRVVDDTPTPSIEALLRDYCKQFDLPMKIGHRLVPITNLILHPDLGESPISIGSVEIRALPQESHIRSQVFESLLLIEPGGWDQMQLSDQRVYNRCRVLARFLVSARDDTKHWERGVEKATVFLEMVRLFISSATDTRTQEIEVGAVTARTYVGALSESDDPWTPVPRGERLQISGVGDAKVIGQGDLAEMQGSAVFKSADTLMTSPYPDAIWERIVRAIGWSSRGRRTRTWRDAVLFQSVALEALLGWKRGRNAGLDLASKIALLLPAESSHDRNTTRLKVRSLWPLRNNIVHEGRGDIGKDDVVLIEEYVRRSIEEVSSLAMAGTVSGNLGKYLTERHLGLPSD